MRKKNSPAEVAVTVIGCDSKVRYLYGIERDEIPGSLSGHKRRTTCSSGVV